MEGLEVSCPCNADGRAVIAVTPGNIVLVFYLHNAGIVAVHPFANLRNVAVKFDSFRIDVPMNTVFREAGVKGHATVFVVAAENSGKSAIERYNSRVEDAVAVWQKIPWNYGICAVSPHWGIAASRSFFPRNIRKSLTNYF